MARHPDFIRFAAAFKQERFEEALDLVDNLIAQHPDEPWLHFHRASTLEKLERFEEIRAELDAALALKPDFVQAIVKRVQYADLQDVYDDVEEDELSEAELERRSREHAARARVQSLQAESELRRALSLDPKNVEALKLLSSVLRLRDGDAALMAEADALLDRALELAPDRIDLLETRASQRRSAALRADDESAMSDEADTVSTYTGMRYSRRALEGALADYERCFALSGEYKYAVRLGMVLHDLGRFDEALARYDEALAKLPADDPAREFILETRARSQDNGAGERDQMAKILESALLGEGKERNLQEDIAVQALLGAAHALRSGRSLEQALEARISDDPETLMATSIAQQILNVAHEPPPGLERVAAADYPPFQRKLADKVLREVEPLGLRHVDDGEAKGLFPMLGQHVLIRFFSDDSGEVGLATFALKPKWPGWIGFLLMLLTGKWKVHRMTECVTQFDDGTLLSTQPDSISPFEYAGPVRIERMPRGTSVQALVERHLQRVALHKEAFPTSTALVADDLDGMERRWREGQRVKRAYRASIGYVTDAELQRMLGGHYDKLGDKVRAQLAVLAEDYV